MAIGYAGGNRTGGGNNLMRQMISAVVGNEINSYFADRSREKRKGELKKAYSSLYPNATGEELDAMLTAWLNGGQVPGAILDKITNRQAMDEWLSNLPPEKKAIIEHLPYESQKEVMIGRAANKLNELERADALNKLITMSKGFPRDSAGDIDWKKVEKPDMMRFTDSAAKVLGNAGGTQQLSLLWNFILFGQWEDPGVVGKSGGPGGGANKIDDLKLVNEVLPAYWDMDWNELPPTIVGLLALSKIGDGIDTAEKWDELRGMRNVYNKYAGIADKQISEELKRMTGDAFQDPFFALSSGVFNPKTNPETGKVSDPYKGIREFMEKTFVPGTSQVRPSVFMDRIRKIHQVAEELNNSINLRGPAKQIHADLMTLYHKYNERWSAKIPDDLKAWGYNEDEIDLFKKAFEKLIADKYSEAVDILKYNVGEDFAPADTTGEGEQ